MTQDELLEAHPRSEPQSPGAEASDRSRGDLDDGDPGLIDSHLGVDRALRQAEGPRRGLRSSGTLRLNLRRQAGRRDVDRLLEEGTVERVGLVEERKHAQLPSHEEAFESNLHPGDEILDEDFRARVACAHRNGRILQDAGEPLPRRHELRWVIGTNYATASRKEGRLENARIPHSACPDAWTLVPAKKPVARRPHPCLGQPLPHPCLVARRGHRGHRVVQQAQPPRNGGGHDRRPLVHTHDGSDRRFRREDGDPVGARREIGKIELEKPRGIEALHRARLLRGNRHVQLELRCRGQEVGRAVARCRQEEQHARHGAHRSPNWTGPGVHRVQRLGWDLEPRSLDWRDGLRGRPASG